MIRESADQFVKLLPCIDQMVIVHFMQATSQELINIGRDVKIGLRQSRLTRNEEGENGCAAKTRHNTICSPQLVHDVTPEVQATITLLKG
jgi:hypothetical protein